MPAPPEPERRRYAVVDHESAELVVIPSLAGVTEPTRVALHNHDTHQYVGVHEVAAGGCLRLPLQDLLPLSTFSVKVQTRESDRWVDRILPARLSYLGEMAVVDVDPAEWGIDQLCTVVVRDPRNGRALHRRRLLQGETLSFAVSVDPALDRLGFELLGTEGELLGSPHHWVRPALRSAPLPPHHVDQSAGLGFTRRSRVTLSPAVYTKGSLFRGYLGAWQDGEPVMEAMEFVLGRQEYQFQPPPTPTSTRDETVVYLGRPCSSWGHFLTQGLARMWFAQQHPELPVLWDSGRLRPYQQQVLDVLGFGNEQRFLTSPTEYAEVIFPFPGVCIGDFVHSGYTRSIGRVKPSPTVPGKKLFLTRSGLNDARGSLAEGQDEALDDLVRRHGFELFHPERHSVSAQLAEISSAEVVLAVEGSALHTVLLFADPVATNFWALTRHRGGTGLFEHIRQSKGLRYQTLNFLQSARRPKRARDTIDLDLEALDRALAGTDGLTRHLGSLEDRLERPFPGQSSIEVHLRAAQARLGRTATHVRDAQLAVKTQDLRSVAQAIGSLT